MAIEVRLRHLRRRGDILSGAIGRSAFDKFSLRRNPPHTHQLVRNKMSDWPGAWC